MLLGGEPEDVEVASEPDGPLRPTLESTTTAPPPTTAPTITRHVSLAGDDGGDGTAARPWRTLQHSFESLQAGDTLAVGGGTYKERLRDLELRGGSAERPIVVEPVAGERVVIEGLLWLEDADHWTVRGINVTWSGENRKSEHMVKLTGGTRWSFVDAEVWDARSFAAILVAGEAKDYRLSGLYVHDTHKSNGRNEDHLIYLNSGTGGGVVERNVLANSPNGRAIKIGPGEKNDGDVANVTIRYNTMYRNLGPSNIQLAWNVSDVEIYRNVFVEPEPDRANVTAFELSGDGNVVRDNVGWGGATVVDAAKGMRDAGGNVVVDPLLADPDNGDFTVTSEQAKAYGKDA